MLFLDHQVALTEQDKHFLCSFLRNRIADVRDECVRTQRQIAPLQDIEWFDPQHLTALRYAKLNKLRYQLSQLNEEYTSLKAQLIIMEEQ